MYFSAVCYLCKSRKEKDSNNRTRQIVDPIGREVFCDVAGVKRSEFYQASTAGYKPEIALTVRGIEYENERYVRYEGVTYKVIRTYPVKNECVELICEGLVADDG